MDQLRDLFFTYAPWVLLWPLILAANLYRRTIPAVQALFWYLLVAFITQAISFIFWKLRKNNYPILHIYTVIEFLLLLWFFYLLLAHYLPRGLYRALALVFPLLALLDAFYLGDIYSFNSYAKPAEALVIIFLCVAWFVKTISGAQPMPAGNQAYYLVVGGFLLYFAGSLALFSFGTYIQKLTMGFRLNVWSLHTLLAVSLYLLIAAGLWKQRKE